LDAAAVKVSNQCQHVLVHSVFCTTTGDERRAVRTNSDNHLLRCRTACRVGCSSCNPSTYADDLRADLRRVCVHPTSGIPSSAEYMHEGTRPSGLSGAIQGASSFPSTAHSTQIRSLTDVHLGLSCQLSLDRIDWLASIADCGCRNRA